jgi:hypothetical protein
MLARVLFLAFGAALLLGQGNPNASALPVPPDAAEAPMSGDLPPLVEVQAEAEATPTVSLPEARAGASPLRLAAFDGARGRAITGPPTPPPER